MLSRRSRFVFLPGFLALGFAGVLSHAQTSGSPPSAPVLTIDGIGKGTAPLDGPWQFHVGDNPAWAFPEVDDSKATGWEQLTADKPWGTQGHESYTGFGWYRRHIEINPALGVKPDFALLITKVDDVYEIYWNGVLVGGDGRMPPNPKAYFRPPPHTFGLGEIRSGVLAVRVWKGPLSSYDSGDIGGFEAVPMLGSPADIAAAKTLDDYKWMRSRQFNFAVVLLYFLVAVLGFVAWLRDRQQWILFWMASFCLSPVLTNVLGGLRLPLGFVLVTGAEQPIFALWDISLWFLLIWLLQLRDHTRLVYWVRIGGIIDLVASSLDGLVTLPLSNTSLQVASQIADGALTGVVVLLEVIPFILVVRALLDRKSLASERWAVAIFACFSEGIEQLTTAAEQGERFTHWTWGNTMAKPMFAVAGNNITAATAARTLLLIALIYSIYRNSVENRKRQSAIELELRNARELQQVLVPEALPALPGFALTSAYRPAQEVGGDFFQIIPLADGSTLIVLGDVSGKGLKAAMAVSLIVGATRMIADYTSSPAEVLAALNRRLIGRVTDGFVTAIALRLKPSGSCVIATAGHPPPFLNQQEMALPGALPLGLTLHAEYEEVSIRFLAGDHFALYTDGLLEARNSTGELYGFDRLEALFGTRPNATQATEAAVLFGQDDDITVLTLTRLNTALESTTTFNLPKLAPV